VHCGCCVLDGVALLLFTVRLQCLMLLVGWPIKLSGEVLGWLSV